MTAARTPGFDGCALLVPTKRLLIFFLVELEFWVDISSRVGRSGMARAYSNSSPIRDDSPVLC